MHSDHRDRSEGELRRPRVTSPEGDEALTDFEQQETLRQQISQLRGYVQRAEFSAREAQVYQLDMRTSFDTAVIARELDIDAGIVRGYRKRYQDKLRKAAGL